MCQQIPWTTRANTTGKPAAFLSTKVTEWGFPRGEYEPR